MRGLAVAAVFAVALGIDGQCVQTFAPGCDSVTLGQLAAGDCVAPGGQYQDGIFFPMSAGQEFAVTLRPLAETYTNPLLALDPPPADGSNAPAVVGGAYGALWFRATSTGTWSVAISSADPAARGAYALHVDCGPDTSPGQPVGCTIQELACNQFGVWNLDASACRFDDGRPYNQWAVWGVAGDDLRLTMTATGFAPLFAVYDEDELLKTSTNDGIRGARMTYRVPRTGWYWIVPTTRSGATGGSYQLQLECGQSGCLYPYFTAPMADVTIGDGGATLSPQLDYHGGGTLLLELVDASNAGVYTTSQTTSIQAPALTKATRVFLRATNECGSHNSNVFVIRPEATKRRTVRH